MLWFRRLIALPLIVAFVALFFVILTITNLKMTVVNPHFYVAEFQKNKAYETIHKDYVPIMLDVVEKENRIKKTEQTKEVKKYVASILQQTFSPEWLQGVAEECLLEILPYIFSQTNQFTVSISGKDCIMPLHQAIQNSISQDESFTFFYEKMIALSRDHLSENIGRDLYGIMSYVNKESDPSTYRSIVRQEIETLLRKIYPKEDLKVTISTYLERMADYFSGNAQDCILELEITRVVRVLKPWCEDMLKRPEVYHYFAEKIMHQIANANGYQLPFGIRYNDEDLKVLYEVFPHSWFQKYAQNILNSTSAYLDKSTDSFNVTIDFTGYEQKIKSVLSKSFNAKLEKAWLSLPEGNIDYDSVLQDIKQGILPLYRPVGMSYGELLRKANINIEQLFMESFTIEIWNKIEITHEALKIDGQSEKPRFSFKELREQATLHFNDIPDTKQLKKNIHKGIHFTESSLKNNRDVREIRQLFSYLPTVLFVGWGVAFILLAIISVLCSDKTGNSLVWALSTLALAALISFAALKTYEQVVFPMAMKEARQNMVANDPIAKVTEEKAYIMISHGNDSMVNHMQNIILGILVFCILMIILYPTLRSMLAPKNDDLQMNDL